MKGNIPKENNMLNISIGNKKTIVENEKFQNKWTLNTVEFFGNVYAKLEKYFPNFKEENFVDLTVEMMFGKSLNNRIEIFGCREYGTTLYALITLVEDKTVFVPTLKSIEKMRIEYKMTANYLPVSLGEKDSMRFEGLKNAAQVMIAALYYYAYHGYKLARCKHCGKWFATKTLKEQYCKRKSPCVNDIIKSKQPLNCEQAVRNIRQQQSRQHRQIYSRFYLKAKNQGEIDSFLTESYILKDEVKRSPSVENCKKYNAFLKKHLERRLKK